MKQLSLKVSFFLILFAAALPAWSQNCQTHDEIPDQLRAPIENAAQQIFDQASRSDVNGLKANSIPSLQSSFGGIESAISDNKAAMSGAHAQVRTTFLLDTGSTVNADGRFYCGIFGANGMAANGAQFYLPNLPVGKWAVVIQDFIGSKGPYSLSTILQDSNGWKLAGFQVWPETALGHDGLWYLQHARDYKAKGEVHNAWFYYVTSWELLASLRSMDTRLLGKITQESNALQPKDVPMGGTPLNYSANGKTYNITDMSVFRTDNSFDLSIKYSVPSTADFNATVTDAKGLANAYVAQYPELKEVFNNIWAHAVDPNGGDVPGLINLKPATAKP